MKILANCLIIVLILLSCSCAKTPSDKAASIEEMFQLMDYDRQSLAGFEAMMPMIESMPGFAQLDAGEKAELIAIYHDWFEKDFDHKFVKEGVAKMYADSFTAEELNELNKFYRSPVGQQFLKMQPALMKSGAKLGMEEGQRKQGKLIERLQPFFDKH